VSGSSASVEPADRPSEPQFVLGVDLDGVCVDFYKKLREIASDWLEKPIDELPEDVTYGLPEWGLDAMGGYTKLHRYAVTQHALFLSAPPIPGAPPALRRLNEVGIRIRIITNRLFIKYFHEQAVQQTIRWLDAHGIPYWDLCLLPDKAAVGADLYVDDTPENIDALRAKGLNAIVFTNSTNQEVGAPRADDWNELEKMILRELDATARRLVAALSAEELAAIVADWPDARIAI
jgi:beta-phosphoglucomutase-like phosphatase (HAD superfamily)